MRRLTIRWRMTLWYAAVLMVVLLAFSAAVYLLMQQHLAARADRELSDELVEVRQEIEEAQTTAELKQRLHYRFDNDAGIDFDIRTSTNASFFRSSRLGRRSLPLPAHAVSSTSPHFFTAQLEDGGRWRIASQTATGPRDKYLMHIGRSLTPEQATLTELLKTFVLIVPLSVATAIAGGYWLAKRALAPIDQMTRRADAISGSHLHIRLPLSGNDDELERLASTLNRMISRLQRSVEEMQQFTADAAHELRTPLAIMHIAAEVALRSAREPEQYRAALENLMEETEQLTHLAGQLLYLSREDSGQHSPPTSPVRLDELVTQVCEQMKMAADEAGLRLTVGSGEPCEVLADFDRLRRALFNLIDNAIKYTGPGGEITVDVKCDTHRAQIVVRDTGIGVAAEQLPHIFRRFYRLPGAAKCPGSGLGLAICKAIVESHGGKIEVQGKLGIGTQFTIMLPATRSL